MNWPNLPDNMIAGVLLGLVMHVLQLACFVIPILIVVPLFIGVTQWVYLLPAYFAYRKRGMSQLSKGILVIGAITFLLNAACFGALMTFGLGL